MSDIFEILLDLADINTILEVGCHRMVDTERLRFLFPKAAIHCIEPDPRNIALIQSDGLPQKFNAALYPVALSDYDGAADFYLSTNGSEDPRNDWTASGSLRPPREFGSANSIPAALAYFIKMPISVVCRSLDSLCAEHDIDRIDFIWMDAQGCENMIIKGGRETFARTRYLYTEHNTGGVYPGAADSKEIMDLLPGWKLLNMWPYDMLLENGNIMSQDYHLGGADSTAGTWMPDVWEKLAADFNLKSVIDVGCGLGANAKWFLDRGLDAVGVEGLFAYIEASMLPSDRIILHDYTLGPCVPDRTFDLGWSSEFVEHVEERFIPNFMATLQKCRYVCITFATPGQGGFHHVNENTHDYWIAKFAEFRFRHMPETTQWMRATGPNTLYGRRTLTFFLNSNLI